MQFSADFVALGLHQADVHRAERELGLRMAAEERGSDDAGASSEPVAAPIAPRSPPRAPTRPAVSGAAVVADGVPPSAITTIPVAAGVGGPWHHEKVTMSAPAMIGRDADLARLDERLDEVRAGAPFTVIIGGEAGIGKTRLIREFEAGLPSDVLLLAGQCVDLGSVAAPYAPVKTALRTLVAEVGAERVLDAVGPGRAALDRAPARARRRPRPTAATAQAAAGAATSQLHEAIAVLLETFSRERPIVFVIEDLHWIDAASLALLRFLMRALGSSRVLTVLSYRTEDVTRGHPVRDFLSEAERDRWVERRDLGRLTRSQVRKLARSMIVDEAPSAKVLDTVFRRSDGVPFFVEELVGIDGCRDEGFVPDTLRELLLARYERLPESAQELLRLISTGGRARLARHARRRSTAAPTTSSTPPHAQCVARRRAHGRWRRLRVPARARARGDPRRPAPRRTRPVPRPLRRGLRGVGGRGHPAPRRRDLLPLARRPRCRSGVPRDDAGDARGPCRRGVRDGGPARRARARTVGRRARPRGGRGHGQARAHGPHGVLPPQRGRGRAQPRAHQVGAGRVPAATTPTTRGCCATRGSTSPTSARAGPSPCSKRRSPPSTPAATPGRATSAPPRSRRSPVGS